jgi:hypothetical protein
MDCNCQSGWMCPNCVDKMETKYDYLKRVSLLVMRENRVDLSNDQWTTKTMKKYLELVGKI